MKLLSKNPARRHSVENPLLKSKRKSAYVTHLYTHSVILASEHEHLLPLLTATQACEICANLSTDCSLYPCGYSVGRSFFCLQSVQNNIPIAVMTHYKCRRALFVGLFRGKIAPMSSYPERNSLPDSVMLLKTNFSQSNLHINY